MKKYIKIVFGILFLLIIMYQVATAKKNSKSSTNNETSNSSPQILKNEKTGTEPFLQGIKPEDIEPFLKKVIYEENAKEHEQERWVYFNEGGPTYITEQFLQGSQKNNGIKDTLYTAKPFQHEAWIGASLGYHEFGNDSSIYTLPKKIYEYEIVNIGDIFINGKPIKDFQYKKTKEGWEIRFPQIDLNGNLLLFGLWVAAKQATIKLDAGNTLKDLSKNDIKNLTETRVVSLQLDKDSKIFEIQGEPPFPKNAKNEFIIFVDGEPVPISWQQKNEQEPRLQITSPTIIHKDQKIEIPLLFLIE